MGLDIVIPLIVLAILVPVALTWAKRTFKDNVGVDHDDPVVAPAERLTSHALRELGSPPWRVVYEVAPGKLGGVGHVLIGPSGVFGLRTTMDPLPRPPKSDADAAAIAQAAITRGRLDDALQRCAMSCDRLIVVHWGANDTAEITVDLMPGVTAVDGRSLATWASTAGARQLTPSQVDLAWQTVVTSIGRPDPLA